MQEDEISRGIAVAEAVDGSAAETLVDGTLVDKSLLSPPFSPISPISANFSFQMDASQIPVLPAGFVINNPKNDAIYTIQEKLGSGGEGHSYLALSNGDSSGDLEKNTKRTVVKFVPVGTAAPMDLEQKLTEEYTRLNTIIPRNYSAFSIGSSELASHLAIVSDFVEGRNLEQELTSRKRTYTPEETVDFLLKVVEKQVKPLHQQGLVHRDLKPANIICTTRNDETDYSFIDFGTLREHNALATVTVNLKGTRGYSRFKGKYECADDYYSLARVAYFLLTGNQPEFVAHERYDKMYDEEVFGAMPLDKRFSKVIFRMLGHDSDKRYLSVDELVKDLQKLKRKVKETKTEDSGMDLNSAQALTHYREAAKFPLDLQRRINGLQERFKEQYSRTKRERNPLDADFKRDLGSVLTKLGYERWNFPKEKELPLYVRKRKESSSIDVLIINDSGDKYFQQYQVKDKKKILDRRKQSADVSQKWYKTGRGLGPVLLPAVGTLGFLAAAPAGITSSAFLAMYSLISTIVFYSNGTFNSYIHEFTSPPSSAKCTLGNGYDKYVFFPSHLFGRLFYDSANGVKKLDRWIQSISTPNDKTLLERALQQAPYFTYSEKARKPCLLGQE